MMERWKAVPGYEGFYAVSDLGRVRSLTRTTRYRNPKGRDFDRISRGRVLKMPPDTGGYPRVCLFKACEPDHRKVHSLVCQAFIGLPPEGYVADHINRVRDDNRLENLRYITMEENCAQGGEANRGENSSASKLREAEVVEIRRLVGLGARQCLVAKMFCVSFSLVCMIVHRRTWTHI